MHRTPLLASLLISLLLLSESFLSAQATAPPLGGEADALSSRSVEDFSKISLDGSSLRSDLPVIVDKTEEDRYIREWITVQWRANDPIYLFVVRPRNVVKPPVVIYLYGFPSEIDTFQDDDWCEKAVADGSAAVGFLPAMTGHRFHGRSAKEWFVSELQESLAASAHDVQMVVNYLNTRGDLDTNRIGMFGDGAGATITLMAASVDTRITAIDLLNPWGDWPTWLAKSKMVPDDERPSYASPEFLGKVAAFDPLVLLPRLTTQHVRLTQFDDDTATPVQAKARIEAARPASAQNRRFQTENQYEGSLPAGDEFHWLKTQLGSKRSTDAQSVKAPAATIPHT